MEGEENFVNAKQHLIKLFEQSLRVTAPSVAGLKPVVTACALEFYDYQCNSAMSLFSKLKEPEKNEFPSSLLLAETIKKNLPQSEMIESCQVEGKGYVNVRLSYKWLSEAIPKMLVDGIDTWAPKHPCKRVIVDFSSPNIAKEMHVGNLRSTNIGDLIGRLLEFAKVEVLRRNHVGDWGTQFGMLIELLFEKFSNSNDINEAAIGDLQDFYREAKKRFDDDPAFKQKAQLAVVKLQSGEQKYRQAWEQICEISRNEFNKIYDRLDVQLEEKGESFYNPFIPAVIQELTELGLVEESKGARVIFIEGSKVPLIIVKSDGGYNYASTDLAALWYRLNKEKADWIIYVTDIGQQKHFHMVFEAAKLAGWLPLGDDKYPKTTHVPFGLVLDGQSGTRFRTRSSDVVRLVDLLDEAKIRCKEALIDRGKEKADKLTEEELECTAEAIGYGAVKYADLKRNIKTDYKFSYEQMLDDKGDTAVYLLYAHARICAIITKSGVDIEVLKKKVKALALSHDDERSLVIHLLKFPEAVEEALMNLLPNVLCKYLYDLSATFTTFYTSCRVLGSVEEASRLLLCEATAVVMRKCFHLLGITPVYKI